MYKVFTTFHFIVTSTEIVTSVTSIIIEVILYKRLKLHVLIPAKAHHPVAGQGIEGIKNAAAGASARHWDIFRQFLGRLYQFRVMCTKGFYMLKIKLVYLDKTMEPGANILKVYQ